MPQAYIVDAGRTPTGRRKGNLAEVHGADLGAHVIKAMVARNNIPAEDYDDVIMGCVDAVGPLAGNIARSCLMVAGMPLSVPGVTVDRQCGSSQQAVHFAAQAVMSGTMDVVFAGGVQTMTQVPIGSSMIAGQAIGHKDPFSGSKGWTERFGDEPVNQFYGAEKMVTKWKLKREDMEVFALESHTRAIAAIKDGRFDKEVIPFGDFGMDETTRETSLEQMAELKVLAEGGSLTAAVASQTSDGASGVLVVSDAALKKYNLTPRARIVHMEVMGDDPIYMLTAPIPATIRAMERSGMKLDDIDLVEINEAFAPVPMAWLMETGYPHEKTNVNGGAIALGHPLGATGTKLMTTLIHELERTGGKYGLQTMCEGGGVANVTIIENLSA